MLVFSLFAVAQMNSTAVSHSRNGIEGAWKIVEVDRVGKPPFKTPEPGLLIFTPMYFSWVSINAGAPRPAKDAVTQEEKIAMWGAITAQSGTYRLTGTRLFLRPLVAKDQHHLLEPEEEFPCEMKGDLLTITNMSADGTLGTKRILRRVE